MAALLLFISCYWPFRVRIVTVLEKALSFQCRESSVEEREAADSSGILGEAPGGLRTLLHSVCGRGAPLKCYWGPWGKLQPPLDSKQLGSAPHGHKTESELAYTKVTGMGHQTHAGGRDIRGYSLLLCMLRSFVPHMLPAASNKVKSKATC